MGEENTMPNFLKGLLALGGIIVIGVFLLMYFLAPPDGAANYARMQWLSQHGDFYGGFVSPLLTFLTFVGVIFTINLQLSEQSYNKKNNDAQSTFLHKQSFEQAFFQMLTIHASIISDLHWSSSGSRFDGRSSFRAYRDELFRMNSVQRQGIPELQNLSEGYRVFWNEHRQSLGHYFRYLYNLIRFVDTTENIDKQRYIRILRAQLSDYELVIIFYNCLTVTGENLRTYVEKYALLNNLAPELLQSQTHIGYLSTGAFNANNEAKEAHVE
jgi:hypothetical protein